MEYPFSEFINNGPEKPAYFHNRSTSDLVRFFQRLEETNPEIETYIRILPSDCSSMSELSRDDLFERRASIISKTFISLAGFKQGVHKLQCMIVGPQENVDTVTEYVKQSLQKMMNNWKFHIYTHLVEGEW